MAGGKTFIDGDEKFDLNIASGDVSTAQIEASAVTSVKIADGAIGNAKIAATGLDISKFTVGTLSLDRIPATLTGKDADTLDGLNSDEFIRKLTVADFQVNPATGTCDNPERINDGELIVAAYFDEVTQYCEVDFGFLAIITQFRWYGSGGNDEALDKCKIQHWDGSAWVDNTVDIPAVLDVMSDWILLTSPVVTSKIRWVFTDIGGFSFRTTELEIKG